MPVLQIVMCLEQRASRLQRIVSLTRAMTASYSSSQGAGGGAGSSSGGGGQGYPPRLQALQALAAEALPPTATAAGHAGSCHGVGRGSSALLIQQQLTTEVVVASCPVLRDDVAASSTGPALLLQRAQQGLGQGQQVADDGEAHLSTCSNPNCRFCPYELRLRHQRRSGQQQQDQGADRVAQQAGCGGLQQQRQAPQQHPWPLMQQQQQQKQDEQEALGDLLEVLLSSNTAKDGNGHSSGGARPPHS